MSLDLRHLKAPSPIFKRFPQIKFLWILSKSRHSPYSFFFRQKEIVISFFNVLLRKDSPKSADINFEMGKFNISWDKLYFGELHYRHEAKLVIIQTSFRIVLNFITTYITSFNRSAHAEINVAFLIFFYSLIANPFW